MDSCIRLWDYVSGSVKKTYQGHKNGGYSIGGCFSVVGGRAIDLDCRSALERQRGRR